MRSMRRMSIVEPIGSLDSFAAHWLESAPLIGAVLGESLSMLAELALPERWPPEVPPELSNHLQRARERRANCARELKELAEEARALANRPVPENFLLRVRSSLAELRRQQEIERELILDAHGWRDFGVGD